MNILFIMVGALGAVFGTVPWVLAAWDGSLPFSRFLLQVTGAVVAIVVGVWTWYATAQEQSSARFIANGLSAIGFALGVFWLAGAALLYMIWPK